MNVTEVGSDEIILRRIPPPPENAIQILPDGGYRATSFRLRLRDGELGLSCSRLALTSPRALLDQLRLQGTSVDGWMVCRLLVADVRSLGLEVQHIPLTNDHGHCEIRPISPSTLDKNLTSKLAKKTRILTPEEIESVQAGDTIP